MGLILSIYKKKIIHRYDEDGFIRYFTYRDFKGLQAEPYDFKSGQHKLKGYFYSYPNCKEDSLVIFCHGIGGGHRSYLKEIETICRHGYKVFTYDLTGCFESEGDSIIGVCQFVADADNAIKSLKRRKILNNYKKVFIIGHSMGGYAAANMLGTYKEISKAVIISGFDSVQSFFKDQFGKRVIYRYEKRTNPKFFKASAIDSLNRTKADILWIHSMDDTVVPVKNSLEVVKEHISNQNIKYILYKDRNHNPNYTKDAVEYMAKTLRPLAELKTIEEKKEYLKEVDWDRMTAQDRNCWDKIFKFLD